MAESAAGSTGRIFISYRREESAYPAGWLFDRLAQHFGAAQIFKDVDSIELGDDFVEVITRAVGSCDVLLALIGDRWLETTDVNARRRIDDPADFVRLEIEAALTRNVRIIPILVDGARMPHADELPAGLAGLVRRQALELSPSRFEYDINRLLRILDTTLAEVHSAHEDAPAISRSAGPEALQNTAGVDVPLTGAARGQNAEQQATPTTQPATHSSHGSVSTHSEARAPDESRRRRLRRLVVIGGSLAALLAIYVVIQLVLDKPPTQEDGAQSSTSNEFKEEAPWRLVVRNDGSSTGCTVTLVNRDTNETWSNEYAVHDTASFLIPQAGTFRWSAESACTVLSRPGPGNLTLPAVVDGVGTSDAFNPPEMITVRLEDLHGNARCDLELRDVATGTVLDIGELNEQTGSVTLQPQGRPLVFLVNDACAVQMSPG
ncbi:toll/interleukin-1 receptor domain-containing protein [Geodermatophilus sp. SYSU D01176]